jgi:hypothetical protein
MRILPPLRPDDFVNSYVTAPLQWMEEIAAVDELGLSAITPHDFRGFTFRLNNSNRFKKWWVERTDVRHLFLLEAAKLDRFGTHLLLSRRGSGPGVAPYGAICPRTAIPEAAQTVRTNYIGPASWDAHSDKDNLLARYVTDIIEELVLTEQPLNSNELPTYCRLKWGLLLRLGPADVDRALNYLAIEKPADSSAPLKVTLGANCLAIAAWSTSQKEPLRVGLSSAWNDDLAIKDLARWLRGFEAAAKAKSDSLTTP